MTGLMFAITLVDIHQGWAWVMICANAIAGVWALLAIKLHGLRRKALWWFTGFAEGAVFIQACLGVAMISIQGREAPEFHYFYGFVAAIAVMLLFAYRQQLSKHIYLWFGLGGLFLMGLGIRALTKI